jgi:hypothetical protein
MIKQTKKLTGITLLKHIVENWDPSDLNPVTVRFKDIWPVIDEYDELVAEVSRLRAELFAIANSEPVNCTQFDWNAEWRYLRNRARSAVNGSKGE